MKKRWGVKRRSNGGYIVVDLNTGQAVAKVDMTWAISDQEKIANLIARAPELEGEQ